MDASRPRRSPANDRFLGLFSSPSPSSSPPAAAAAASGDELHEDDLLFSSSEAALAPDNSASSKPPSRVPYSHFGLLAALHDGDKKLLLRRGTAATAAAGTAGATLRRKATIAAASAAAAPAASAARAIPANPGPMLEPSKPFHQSAPVKVPVRPQRRPAAATRDWDELGRDGDDDFLLGDAAMLPPHEMVGRASAGGSHACPVAPFSVLEGAGRTLKGRDLRRVRDAVLRQTGFLD